jgi:hypothetical protein
MKMEHLDEKYEKVLEILRRAEPVLGSPEDIREKVMQRISVERNPANDISDLVDFLFGWTYITWVRRSLITASVFLVLVFVFQQSMIMTQINNLSRQIDSYERDATGVSSEYMNRRLLLYRFSERRFPFTKKSTSDKQVEELFRSIDQLKKEYKDLNFIIEQDPELKQLIEKKLSEISDNKIKL